MESINFQLAEETKRSGRPKVIEIASRLLLKIMPAGDEREKSAAIGGREQEKMVLVCRIKGTKSKNSEKVTHLQEK